jgi:hypothetical protein
MGKPLCLAGATFGRLWVVGEAPPSRRQDGKSLRMWDCLCSCGAKIIIHTNRLTSGNTRSCGCLKRETAVETGRRNRRHGMIGTPTYESWSAMLSRCRYAATPNNRCYAGIAVCARWDPRHGGSFENFKEDMGQRQDGTSLDRFPDRAGNYEPGNCRWATVQQQNGNRRDNVLVEVGSSMVTLAAAARLSGIHPDTLGLRYRNGERGDRLFRKTERTGRRAWKSRGSEQSSSGSSQFL